MTYLTHQKRGLYLVIYCSMTKCSTKQVQEEQYGELLQLEHMEKSKEDLKMTPFNLREEFKGVIALESHKLQALSRDHRCDLKVDSIIC